jgi:hypothetical protein
LQHIEKGQRHVIVDYKQQLLKRKNVVTIAILILLVAIIIRDLYLDEQDDIEKDYVEKVLSKAQKNLNAKAIHTIIEKIGTKRNFSFIVLGDNQGRLGTFKKVVKEALGHKPDFIIHTGDMTSSGKDYQYLDFMQALKNIAVPVVCIIGNHDDNNLGKQSFSYIFGPHNFYFPINDYLFVFLDNNEANTIKDFVKLGDSTSLQMSNKFEDGFDDHQMQQLEILLQKRKKTFITMHKPPPIKPFLFHSFDRNSSRFLEFQLNKKIIVFYSLYFFDTPARPDKPFDPPVHVMIKAADNTAFLLCIESGNRAKGIMQCGPAHGFSRVAGRLSNLCTVNPSEGRAMINPHW